MRCALQRNEVKKEKSLKGESYQLHEDIWEVELCLMHAGESGNFTSLSTRKNQTHQKQNGIFLA